MQESMQELNTKRELFIKAVLSSWRLPWQFDEDKLYYTLLDKYTKLGLTGDELREKVETKMELKHKKYTLARMNATTIAKIAERIYGND